jgi:hypothetical protein
MFNSVHQHLLQDVREFWKRSNLYLVVHGALLSVYLSAVSIAPERTTFARLTIGFLALLLALFWFGVARASVKWTKLWDDKVREMDAVIDRHALYRSLGPLAEKGVLTHPQQLTQYVPLVFAAGWGVLLVLAAF